MFTISLMLDDLVLSNIEKKDVPLIQKWLNSQSDYIEISAGNPLNSKEFYQRFVEYYVSECEFFLKIEKIGETAGVLKGRIDFKNPNEVWLWYFIIDEKKRNQGIGTRVLQGVIEHFFMEYGIRNFFAIEADQNMESIQFWKKNGFKLLRVSKNFFNVDGRGLDMLIMKRNKIQL